MSIGQIIAKAQLLDQSDLVEVNLPVIKVKSGENEAMLGYHMMPYFV